MKFVAVFIDWENIEKTVKQSYGSILIYDEFVHVIRKIGMKHGELIGIFAYGDFDKGEAGLQTKLMQLGIQPRHVVTKTPHEYLKGSTDIELSLDILEMMYNYPHITDFLFISGDGDLMHVIRRLKMNGKTIHLMGFKDRTNKILLDMVNSFDSLDNFPDIMRKVTKAEKERKMLTFLTDNMIKEVVNHLDLWERTLNKDFIGLNYFRNKLIDRFPETEISDALTNCIDYELILTYLVENPNDPKNPTTACRLNRKNHVVQQLLSKIS